MLNNFNSWQLRSQVDKSPGNASLNLGHGFCCVYLLQQLVREKPITLFSY